jgi:hypothetical protein
MGEELSNFASEAFAFGCAALSERRPTSEELRATLADDFRLEDRRPGRLMGNVDGEGMVENLLAAWETGAGIPEWRVHGVVAVRGDRFAVCRYDLDYGNGMMTANLGLIGFDPTLTVFETFLQFDADDVDGAIAELNRLGGSASGLHAL